MRSWFSPLLRVSGAIWNKRSASAHRAQGAFTPRKCATLIALQLGQFLIELYETFRRFVIRKVVRLKQPSPDLSNPHQVYLRFGGFANMCESELRAARE